MELRIYVRVTIAMSSTPFYTTYNHAQPGDMAPFF